MIYSFGNKLLIERENNEWLALFLFKFDIESGMLVELNKTVGETDLPM